MNIFHLIFSRLLDLDPLPARLCYEYIKRTQRKIILFVGKEKKNPTEGGVVKERRIRTAEEGHGIIKRPFFFISSFWGQ